MQMLLIACRRSEQRFANSDGNGIGIARGGYHLMGCENPAHSGYGHHEEGEQCSADYVIAERKKWEIIKEAAEALNENPEAYPPTHPKGMHSIGFARGIRLTPLNEAGEPVGPPIPFGVGDELHPVYVKPEPIDDGLRLTPGGSWSVEHGEFGDAEMPGMWAAADVMGGEADSQLAEKARQAWLRAEQVGGNEPSFEVKHSYLCGCQICLARAGNAEAREEWHAWQDDIDSWAKRKGAERRRTSLGWDPGAEVESAPLVEASDARAKQQYPLDAFLRAAIEEYDRQVGQNLEGEFGKSAAAAGIEGAATAGGVNDERYRQFFFTASRRFGKATVARLIREYLASSEARREAVAKAYPDAVARERERREAAKERIRQDELLASRVLRPGPWIMSWNMPMAEVPLGAMKLLVGGWYWDNQIVPERDALSRWADDGGACYGE
jgi:hypothetical protein